MGDNLLIKPTTPAQRTETGLYLPEGMHKKQELRTGYVIKVGPGYPIPMIRDEDESWKDKAEGVKYVPLQALTGDLAVYRQPGVHELVFNGEEYVIAPHRSVLMTIRDEDFIL